MISVSLTDYNTFLIFWLSFSRWVAIFFQLPILDSKMIPGTIKIFLSILVAYALLPEVEGILMKELAAVGVENIIFLTIYHAFTGLIIGFLVRSIMNIFIATGMVMTQQIGFGGMRYFDPTFLQSIGPFERLIQMTILMGVLFSGALLPMIKGALISFHSINLFNLTKLADSPSFFTTLFVGFFSSAVLLATPLLFTNILVTTVMGIIARLVPQMNVLMVSFVINIGVGLVVFLMISFEFFQVGFKVYTDFLGKWYQYIL